MPLDEEFEKKRIRHQQIMDQAGTMITDQWPPVVRSMHDKLMTEGFSDQQAFKLTLMWWERTLS